MNTPVSASVCRASDRTQGPRPSPTRRAPPSVSASTACPCPSGCCCLPILAASQDTPDPVATLVDGAPEQRKRCVELGADEIQWGDLNPAEVPGEDQVEAMAAALDLIPS